MGKISRWVRRTGRSSQKAGALLRGCVSLLITLELVYTPFHLAAEPHSDEVDLHLMSPSGPNLMVLGELDHGGEGHHERHPASQHKLKLARSQRAPAPEMVPVTVIAVELLRECIPVRVFSFSGLSPPELPRSWQFVFRAALPVRAPSLLS